LLSICWQPSSCDNKTPESGFFYRCGIDSAVLSLWRSCCESARSGAAWGGFGPRQIVHPQTASFNRNLFSLIILKNCGLLAGWAADSEGVVLVAIWLWFCRYSIFAEAAGDSFSSPQRYCKQSHVLLPVAALRGISR